MKKGMPVQLHVGHSGIRGGKNLWHPPNILSEPRHILRGHKRDGSQYRSPLT